MQNGWVSRWWTRLRPRAERGAAADDGSAPRVTSELQTLLETTRKSARAVLRLDARFDGLEQQLGVLRADVRALRDSHERSEGTLWSPLMDVIDRLDAAREAIDRGQVEGAGFGLASIGSRLEALLATAGYQRHGALGRAVDGRLHRVVGTVALVGAPEGTVGRVVRAPVTRGDDIIRTGEVLAVKHSDINDGRLTE